MSHLVSYDTTTGPVFRKVDELHEAIALVEQLRNDVGLERARIYRLDEVAFEFKPYFRVAIAEGPPAGWGDPFVSTHLEVPAAVVAADELASLAVDDAVAELAEVAEDEAVLVPAIAAVPAVPDGPPPVTVFRSADEPDTTDAAVIWREPDHAPSVDAGTWISAAAGPGPQAVSHSGDDLGSLPPPPGTRRNIFGR